ncbi:marine proteobacterial sortase target protein [Litorilituus lipolyticus]|uniref:Marine proteobacterial sortase target protein n=1 Tax=Litorilituus lipolyticus TaxID=2491017 RepID=A0A502KKM5_9GAMM|nr:marine proteobacterial sortase target protein [Litorilituus lipolyticus]TPH12140.1 marine proteobacterial sortase target protein [Litorilituus lipolyticus]
MIKATPKEKQSIYYQSYHQYKKPRRKWPIVVLCITVIVGALFNLNKSYAQRVNFDSAQRHASLLNDVGTGQLLFNEHLPLNQTEKHSTYNKSALLMNSRASFDINGLIAKVTVEQSFLNQSDQLINAIYAFPLPDNSAVNQLKVQIGERKIIGKIMEKSQAKKVFQKALKSGKKASLVEQHRPNLFTNKIANIAAKEQITVTLTYYQHIDFKNDMFSLRFPMNITPRYQPNRVNSQQGLEGSMAEQLAFSGSKNNKQNIQLSISLNAGVPLAAIKSPSHDIQTFPILSNSVKSTPNDEEYNSTSAIARPMSIKLSKGQTVMNKDFILQWQASPSATPQLAVFKEEINQETYALAMILPPQLSFTPDQDERVNQQSSDDFSRHITFVIDTSGSMQGSSIIQAKQSLLFALNTLNPHDKFNIIAFNSSYQSSFSQPQPINQQSIEAAKHFINQLHANGGTRMYEPLSKALTTSALGEAAIKQVIFITDGAVSNELELFKLIHQTHNLPRLFTVGIGSAPNSYFMRKAAQFGRGTFTHIGNVNQVQKKMTELLTQISQPALRNINLQFQPLHVGTIEQYPSKIPDLYQGEPLLIAIKTKMMPASIQVFGELANQGWHREISLVKEQQHTGISTIWAKAKITDLLDGLVTGKDADTVKKTVLKTSLQHQVISPYSSFIAVEQAPETPHSLPMEEQLTAKTATPFPKTALGWQAPFFSGLVLLIFSLFWQCKRAQNASA